ncbi:MAG TPA: isoprenyl transferase [bacterium]|nr:isoprenyl transferase [bacterium]
MKNKKTNIPYHIAMIMDGNRRWAKKRGSISLAGHKKGFENFKKIAEECWNLGVKILTVYAFSTENWKRSEKEINYLMKLFERILSKEKSFFRKHDVKLNVIGQTERLPKELKKMIYETMKETKNNETGILNLAISYGGRQEILEAVKKVINKKTASAKLTEKVFESCLYTAGQPDPDLLIRTGGEMRLSGFLPWQSVYSELYFSDRLWPDFSISDLKGAIKEFQRRQRRFGK